MDIIYEEDFYYSTYDSGAKYKINGDRLDNIVMSDGTALSVSTARDKLAEYGVLVEFNSEKTSSNRSEVTYSVKVGSTEVLPIIIKGWNEDSYSCSGYTPEDYGSGPFEIKISEDEKGEIIREQLR